jgi:hypothetical protein
MLVENYISIKDGAPENAFFGRLVKELKLKNLFFC